MVGVYHSRKVARTGLYQVAYLAEGLVEGGNLELSGLVILLCVYKKSAEEYDRLDLCSRGWF